MREPKHMKFTEAALNKLLSNGRPQRQTVYWDSEARGLCVLVSRGPKHKRQATITFRVLYYMKDRPGEARYYKIGRWPDECPNLQDVRDKAQLVRMEARQGIDPRKPRLTGTFAETVKRFIEEYAVTNRTWRESERILNHYVIEEWADKNIESVTREDVNSLLNKISRGKIEFKGKSYGSPSTAWVTRAQLVTLFKWYEFNHTVGKDYRNPIPLLMKNSPLKPPSARARVLTDEEIRALWIACGGLGVYGALVKTALLTAQRFRKVGVMRRSDLKAHFHVQGEDVGHVWDAAREDDPKNKRVSLVPLSGLARKVLAGVPIITSVPVNASADFVFTHNGRKPIAGWAKNKERLDERMLALLRADNPEAELPPWQGRDLRRTARTLLARLRIPSDVAEHALAHVLPGIQKVYNRYDYFHEKREAFERLAELIEHIANPTTPANQVPMTPERRRGP
jgi:hypothetical protein